MTFDLESAGKGFNMAVKIAKNTAMQSSNLQEFLKKFDEETKLVRC